MMAPNCSSACSSPLLLRRSLSREPSADPDYAFLTTPAADEHAVETSKRVMMELSQRMKVKKKGAGVPGRVNKNKRGE